MPNITNKPIMQSFWQVRPKLTMNIQATTTLEPVFPAWHCWQQKKQLYPLKVHETCLVPGWNTSSWPIVAMPTIAGAKTQRIPPSSPQLLRSRPWPGAPQQYNQWISLSYTGYYQNNYKKALATLYYPDCSQYTRTTITCACAIMHDQHNDITVFTCTCIYTRSGLRLVGHRWCSGLYSLVRWCTVMFLRQSQCGEFT